MHNVADSAIAPIALEGPSGRTILLKWHVLRRTASDVPFDRGNLRIGASAGASVEIDIQALANGDWVVLHDSALDRETTGTGLVAGQAANDVKSLSMRDPETGNPAAPVVHLSEMTAAVGDASPPVGFILQLDLKAPLVTAQARARFMELVAPIAEHCVLSGGDWNAVSDLGSAIPGLRLGFDPLEMKPNDPQALQGSPEAMAMFAGQILSTAPQATWLYFHHRLVIAALEAGIDLIAEAHALGQRVDVWTLDPVDDASRSTVERLIGLGVDQITTNDAVGWHAWQHSMR